MFQIDMGSTGGEGPWIAWSARGTQDRAIPPESFFLRDGDQKTPFAGFQNGIVLDIDSMRTGWQQSEGIRGVAPKWQWNPSPAQMMQSPGEDYKRGFSIRCAIGGGKTATWEQSGAAVWNALGGIAPQLAEQPAGKLPLVKWVGTNQERYTRGSTAVPVLQVVKWVDKPDCLKAGAAAGIAIAPAPAAPAARPAPAPAPVPQPDASFTDF